MEKNWNEPIMLFCPAIIRNASMTTFPLTLCTGSTTTATALASSCSKDVCVCMSTLPIGKVSVRSESSRYPETSPSVSQSVHETDWRTDCKWLLLPRQPAAETRMWVVPADDGFFPTRLGEHFEHVCLENVIYCLHTYTRTMLSI